MDEQTLQDLISPLPPPAPLTPPGPLPTPVGQDPHAKLARIAAIAAAIAGGRATGLGGLVQGLNTAGQQQDLENLRRYQLQENARRYQNQVLEQQQQSADAHEAQRQRIVQSVLADMAKTVPTFKELPDYERYMQSQETGLRDLVGSRLNGRLLRQMHPFVAPTAEERVKEAAAGYLKLNQKAIEKDPSVVDRDQLTVDLQDSGTPQAYPARVVLEQAGYHLTRMPSGKTIIEQIKGAPFSLPKAEILAAVAPFERRNFRTPTDEEMGPILAQLRESRRATPPATGATPNDPKDIADAIIRGEQPPTTTGLYRNASPVRAELARKGYDLATATQDWQATTRYLATLNGPQQIRLRQAVNFAYESLPLVEELASQWKGGQFPLLNKANLVAAKNGAYGPAAASLATRLDQQVADLQSELAVVYRGGTSPTDEAMRKADAMLRSDWSERTLRDAVTLIKRNLQIRQNSIKSAGIADSGNNRYAPPDQGTPVPAAGPVSGIKVGDIKYYRGQKVRVVAIDPNGNPQIIPVP